MWFEWEIENGQHEKTSTGFQCSGMWWHWLSSKNSYKNVFGMVHTLKHFSRIFFISIYIEKVVRFLKGQETCGKKICLTSKGKGVLKWVTHGWIICLSGSHGWKETNKQDFEIQRNKDINLY